VDGETPQWTIADGAKILPKNRQEVKPDLTIMPKMIKIPAGKMLYGKKLNVSTLPFELGETEVSYRQWNEVQQWAKLNGYEFNHDGAMGSMTLQHGHFTFKPTEPVTTVSFYDAMLWLNALSELTEKTPMSRDVYLLLRGF